MSDTSYTDDDGMRRDDAADFDARVADGFRCYFCDTFFDQGEDKNLCECMARRFEEYARWDENATWEPPPCIVCGGNVAGCQCMVGKVVKFHDTYTVGDQPRPSGSGEAIVDMVKRDLDLRKEFGTKKYGQPLMANNGRSALKDAYEEALDLCCYLRQALAEEND